MTEESAALTEQQKALLEQAAQGQGRIHPAPESETVCQELVDKGLMWRESSYPGVYFITGKGREALEALP